MAANLSYDDVRRAAQEAVRDLQHILNELRSSHDDIRRSMQQLDNVTFRLNSMQTQLNLMQQQLDGHVNSMKQVTGSQGAEQASRQAVADMNRRLAAMEQVMRASYQFLAVQEQRYQQWHR